MANRSENIITPRFRASFVHVAQPKRTQSGGVKYSCTMLISKAEDISVLQGAITSVAQAEWPQNWQGILTARNPLKDGDTAVFTQGANVGKLKKDVYPEYAGNWVVDATSNNPIGVVDNNSVPLANLADFYSGCIGIAYVNAYTYNKDGNMGVGVGLQALQKVGDGERLGGGAVDAASIFAAIPAAPGAAPAPAPQQYAAPAPQQYAAPAPAPAQPVPGVQAVPNAIM